MAVRPKVILLVNLKICNLYFSSDHFFWNFNCFTELAVFFSKV